MCLAHWRDEKRKTLHHLQLAARSVYHCRAASDSLVMGWQCSNASKEMTARYGRLFYQYTYYVKVRVPVNINAISLLKSTHGFNDAAWMTLGSR